MAPTAASLTIVLLGAGHVAAHLAPAIVAAGHCVAGVWSRDPARAAALVACLPVGTAHLRTPADAAALAPDVVLVAVPDQVVATVIAAAALPATVVVAHTAGTLPLPDHPRAGVFYPLQTFSAGRPLDVGAVPFCLEASDATTAAILERLARSLSRRPPLWLTVAERAPLHLAAVFAANFPNHLLGISRQIIAASGLKMGFDVLRPLVEEMVAKAFTATEGPFSVQTGPAVRYDSRTLAAHHARLAADIELAPWAPLYEALTAAIQQVAEGVPRPLLPVVPTAPS